MNVSAKSDNSRRVLAVVRHPVGGVRTHILYIYPILMQAGYRFTFVIPQEASHAVFRSDVASWEGTEIVEVPYSDFSQGKINFRPTVRGLLKQKMFCLIHSHGIQAAVSTVLANIGISLPHISTSHDVFCHVDVSGIKGRVKLRALERILRRLDFLIAVSGDTRGDHLQYLPGLEKGRCRVKVIPNGIDINQYAERNGAATRELRNKLSLGDDVFLLGFLGRFMEQKGFLVLVEALERLLAAGPTLRPVHLLAVGSGDCLVNYRWELDCFPLAAGRITFLGQVPNVAPILQELDLLVMPSLWEACPILPMEAMVMGVPVLGTDCIGLREVLQGTPSVMVPIADAEALASAIDRAIRSPWTEAARQFVPEARKRFDVGKQVDGLRLLFDKLTA